MPHAPLHIAVDDPAVVAGLARIRREQRVPSPHPPEVVAAARDAAARVLSGLHADSRRDARDLELVTIDPPGSRDLDQAVQIESRRGAGGWRIHYAIADVAAFVEPGGTLDQACWSRGLTFYLPDGRAPLHPEVLDSDAASLIPDQDRAAALWTMDVDADGVLVASEVARAVVRSRAQLTYQQVQQQVDAGTAPESLRLLREVGEARLRQEIARGGVSLDLPAQRVEASNGGYRIEFETTVPAMSWNAQISLLAGMAAAERMVAAGIGLLRTLPPPNGRVVDRVRRTARALGVAWPEGASYASVVGGLRSADPDEAVLLALASRGLRGAGYIALPPADAAAEPPATLEHAAVAAPYAHVTAPLRRLGDRFATETCLAVEAGATPPDWVVGQLPDVPDTRRLASAHESGAAQSAIDLVEALVLRPLVGREIDVTVVAVTHDSSTVVCRDPAIQTRVDGYRLELGSEVTVKVLAADPAARRVELQP